MPHGARAGWTRIAPVVWALVWAFVIVLFPAPGAVLDMAREALAFNCER